jgi:hypothetical protein
MPVDAEEWLTRLRREFPLVGILHDPGNNTWMAVRGKNLTVQAPTASELRERLLEIFGPR